MRKPSSLIVLAALALGPSATPTLAQALRNPVGTAPAQGTVGTARSLSSAPTSPMPGHKPLGSGSSLSGATGGVGGAGKTAPGHTLGAGPNSPGGSNGTGLGGGGPNAGAPSAANAGPGPGPLSGSRPNGGALQNGSKGTVMRANGVQKLQ